MDSRKKKVLTVLCIGVLILGWRVFVVVSEYLPTQAQAGGQQIAAIDGAVEKDEPVADDLRGLLDAQRQMAEKDWGRNPFADVPWAARPETVGENVTEPGARTPPPTPSLVLKGVSRSGPRWLAAVNGKIVRVGDAMEGGYTIAEITAQSITLESRGWAFTFVMGSEGADIRRLSGAP
jgi:hypothetical protein